MTAHIFEVRGPRGARNQQLTSMSTTGNCFRLTRSLYLKDTVVREFFRYGCPIFLYVIKIAMKAKVTTALALLPEPLITQLGFFISIKLTKQCRYILIVNATHHS